MEAFIAFGLTRVATTRCLRISTFSPLTVSATLRACLYHARGHAGFPKSWSATPFASATANSYSDALAAGDGTQRDVVWTQARPACRIAIGNECCLRKLRRPGLDVNAEVRLGVERAEWCDSSVPILAQEVARARDAQHPRQHALPLTFAASGLVSQSKEPDVPTRRILLEEEGRPAEESGAIGRRK